MRSTGIRSLSTLGQRSLTASPQLLRPQFNFRQFSSEKEESEEPAVALIDDPMETPEERERWTNEWKEHSHIHKYGLYPFAGLSLAALLSKELLFFDESVLLIANFLTVMSAIYIGAGHSCSQMLEKRHQEFLKSWNDTHDMGIETLKAYNKIQENMTHMPDIMDRQIADFERMVRDAYAKNVVAQQVSLRNKVVEKLEAIKLQESLETSKQNEEFMTDLLEVVNHDVEHGDQTAFLDEAIDRLQTDGSITPLKDDHFVFQAFENFCTDYEHEYGDEDDEDDEDPYADVWAQMPDDGKTPVAESKTE
jgi:hypothetical protein